MVFRPFKDIQLKKKKMIHIIASRYANVTIIYKWNQLGPNCLLCTHNIVCFVSFSFCRVVFVLVYCVYSVIIIIIIMWISITAFSFSITQRNGAGENIQQNSNNKTEADILKWTAYIRQQLCVYLSVFVYTHRTFLLYECDNCLINILGIIWKKFKWTINGAHGVPSLWPSCNCAFTI